MTMASFLVAWESRTKAISHKGSRAVMELSHTVEKRTDTITMFPQWVELYTLILSETKKLIYRHSR